MNVGSNEHGDLCWRTFIDARRAYEAANGRRAIPFWGSARTAAHGTGLMVTASATGVDERIIPLAAAVQGGAGDPSAAAADRRPVNGFKVDFVRSCAGGQMTDFAAAGAKDTVAGRTAVMFSTSASTEIQPMSSSLDTWQGSLRSRRKRAGASLSVMRALSARDRSVAA